MPDKLLMHRRHANSFERQRHLDWFLPLRLRRTHLRRRAPVL